MQNIFQIFKGDNINVEVEKNGQILTTKKESRRKLHFFEKIFTYGRFFLNLCPCFNFIFNYFEILFSWKIIYSFIWKKIQILLKWKIFYSTRKKSFNFLRDEPSIFLKDVFKFFKISVIKKKKKKLLFW